MKFMPDLSSRDFIGRVLVQCIGRKQPEAAQDGCCGWRRQRGWKWCERQYDCFSGQRAMKRALLHISVMAVCVAMVSGCGRSPTKGNHYATTNTTFGPGQGEVWISATTNADLVRVEDWHGNPYYTNLDDAIGGYSSNTDFKLSGGTFKTAGSIEFGFAGGIHLKQGDTIEGDGEHATTIQWSTNVLMPDRYIDVIYSPADEVTIKNLTIDCNGYSTNFAQKVNGLVLQGNYETADNVAVINALGQQPCEAWGIFMGTSYDSVGNRILNCVFSDPHGNYCKAFMCVGQMQIRGFQIYQPLVTNAATASSGGINFAYANNDVISDGYIFGGDSAFYGDTGNFTNILVSDVICDQCLSGFYIGQSGGMGGCNNIKFNNDIFVANPCYFFGQRGQIRIDNLNTNFCPDIGISIIGCSFRFPGDQAPKQIDGNQNAISLRTAALPGCSSNFIGAIIEGNHIDRRLPSAATGLGNVVTNNLDLNGQPYTNWKN
jgi:hypothetical protein